MGAASVVQSRCAPPRAGAARRVAPVPPATRPATAVAADVASPPAHRPGLPLDAVLARAVLARAGEADEMRKTAGYKALSPEWKARLDALVSGRTTSSARAPAELRKILDAKTADKSDPSTLRDFARGAAHLPNFVEFADDWKPDLKKAHFGAPTKVRDHAFKAWTADALRYTVTVQAPVKGRKMAHKIQVFAPRGFTPVDPDHTLPTMEYLTWALAELPVDSLVLVKRVHLNPVPNPEDQALTTEVAALLGTDKLESSMSASGTGDIYIYPSAENADVGMILRTLVHETGHLASERVLSDDEVGTGWSQWFKAMTDDGGLGVSIYARAAISEDFAESWALWLPLRGDPREAEVAKLIPHRVRFMAAIADTGKAPAG